MRTPSHLRWTFLGVLLLALLLACTPSVRDQMDALYAQERAGDLSFEQLELSLANESHHVRVTAASLLGRRGDLRAVEALAAASDDEDGGVRATVAVSLGRLGDVAGEPTLIRLASDESTVVRLKALVALGKVKGPLSGPTLFRALDEEINSDLREAAVVAVSEIADPASVDKLIDLLEDDHVIIRGWAARGLGDIGDLRALPALERLFESESTFDRGAAEQAMAAIRQAGAEKKK